MRAKSPFIDNKKKALEKAKKINDHFKARVKDRELMITHLLQTEEVNDIQTDFNSKLHVIFFVITKKLECFFGLPPFAKQPFTKSR